MMKLNDEQQRVFDSITQNPHGLHILTSTPKSGKTFFVKYITQHFHMHGKNVLLSVTTGATTLF
jgi:type II secretory ATPase GspE/PulE/Tfp pilus assembly ATPase PilB-like protein